MISVYHSRYAILGWPSTVRFPRIQSLCPLCRADSAVLISRAARDGSRLDTALCEGCGLARVHPLPSRQELAAFYRDQYRLLYKGVYEPKPVHVLRAARAARERIRVLQPYLASARSLVDIGCGGGEFLYLLRAAGYQVAGIEPNLRYGQRARDSLGLPVRIGLIEDQTFPPNSLDGVTLFHVLEHLPDPVFTLSHLAPWLKTDGFLAIEVPNLASTVEHPAHRFHRAHLFHFTSPTLELCASQAGFAALRLETSPDGGNLLGVFRRTQQTKPVAQLREHAVQQLRLESSRSALRYWIRPATWMRTVRRLRRMAEERRTALRYASREEILAAEAAAITGQFRPSGGGV